MAVLQSDYLKSHDCRTAGELIQKQEGCYEPKPVHTRWQFEGFEFDRCPAHYVQRNSIWLQDIFEIYAWAEKGLLPEQGSWLDQPNVVIEALNFISYLMSKKIKTGDKNGNK